MKKTAKAFLAEWQLIVAGALIAAALVGVCVWAFAVYNYSAIARDNQRLREAAATKLGAEWRSGRINVSARITARPDETAVETAGRLVGTTEALKAHFKPED